ncbi:hypothetical protein KFL_001570250 [Klebsormidium nitens]|uniref:Tetratricopeptide repeat-containing protein n=1 Tax=Klebsormidium nitens TaxID=105231 RepID=A0A0U9HV25_KLENI|nr:hypothetical protein KFL_001570250 [Klebsormidium nitens]|eukprot:GAQ83686.1 hypothetical protein KFL_001570250 [Klebsormidium nitens]
MRRLLPFGRSKKLAADPACTRGRILHFRVTRAHSHLLQALLLFRLGTASSYVTGALKLKSCWNAYQQLYEEDVVGSKDGKEQSGAEALASADRGDILYGIGGFHFFVSLVPPAFKWIVESLGFKGDQSASQPQLRECICAGGNRVYAAYLLLIWQDTFFFKARERAERLFEEATERFESKGTHSALFQYLGGYLARVRGGLDLAIERFERAHAASSEVRPFQLMCLYEIGWCHFLVGDYSRAVERFVPFLAEFRSPSYHAFCAYQLGCALDLLGRRKEATAAMTSVAGYVRKHFTFDQYAARRARLYIKRGGMSEFDRAILPVHSSIEIKDFRGALKLLQIARCHVSSGAGSFDGSAEPESESGARMNSPAPSGAADFERDAEDALCRTNARVLDRRKTRTYLDTELDSNASAKDIRFTEFATGLQKPGASIGHVAAEKETTRGWVEGVDKPPGTVPIVDDESAVYMFCLAQSLVGVKRDDLALDCYKAILNAQREIREEFYIVPYSWVGVGEIYHRKSDLSAAEEALLVAKKRYSGYDFDKPLIRRIEHAVGLLKGARSEEAEVDL